MSVKVTSFDDPVTWPFIHDDARPEPHGGTLDPATVTYGKNVDGSDDLNVVVVPCPGCGSVSFWPPGGGADALLGQMLHVHVGLNAQPAARGGATRDVTSVVEDVKQRVIATDGEERWVLDDAALSAMGVA